MLTLEWRVAAKRVDRDRLQDSRLQDSRLQDSRLQASRLQDSRLQDSRLGDFAKFHFFHFPLKLTYSKHRFLTTFSTFSTFFLDYQADARSHHVCQQRVAG